MHCIGYYLIMHRIMVFLFFFILIGDASAATDAEDALSAGNQAFEAGETTVAHENWEVAAKLGNADAQFNLGIALLQSGDAQVAGGEWLEHAAQSGHLEGRFAYGTWLAMNATDSKQLEAGTRWLRSAAEDGHTMAHYNLAVILEEGGQDRDSTIAHYRAAAERELSQAQAALARLDPPVAQTSSTFPATEPVVHTEQWLREAPAHWFTLQVATGRSGVALAALLERIDLQWPSAWFRHRSSGPEPYSAVVGAFESVEDAQAALAALPRALQSNRPWIRRFDVVQEELPRSD
ncbi:MAG: SPOR domain-containing protein [Pseudomonadota bacterium]